MGVGIFEIVEPNNEDNKKLEIDFITTKGNNITIFIQHLICRIL